MSLFPHSVAGKIALLFGAKLALFVVATIVMRAKARAENSDEGWTPQE